MNSREESRREVRRAVRTHMAARAWNKAELQEAAGIDANTAGDFLNGVRWPQAKTLAKIEAALEWAPGTIAGILDGDKAPDVGGPSEDDDVSQGDSLLFQRPPGLSDQQWEQIRNDMGEYLELEIRRASRQR